MNDVVFVTGNPEKAANFSKHMGETIPHVAADLDEIQTLDTKKLVEHKARQAYSQIKKPVLVEDVTLVFHALGSLPGPFIKFFVTMPDYADKMCRLLDGMTDRGATAACAYGFFDGESIQFFTGAIDGQIANNPRGSSGYGFDRVFEPQGFRGRTAGELNDADYDAYYSTIKPFEDVKDFLYGR